MALQRCAILNAVGLERTLNGRMPKATRSAGMTRVRVIKYTQQCRCMSICDSATYPPQHIIAFSGGPQTIYYIVIHFVCVMNYVKRHFDSDGVGW